MNKNNLMRKDGQALINLSKYFLNFEIMEKIDTISHCSKMLDLSVGTVQKAMKQLEELKGIKLKRKGHLGTYIEEMNYSILLKLSGAESLIGVMPLPYSKRYEGLASGIKKEISKLVPLYFAHMRGANTRLTYLQKGMYDFAIVSKLAAKEYIKKDNNLHIAMEFPQGTYVKGHGLIYKSSKIKRIGVDKSSLDQYFLTKMNFHNNEDYEIVDVNYSEIINLINNNYIDAAIWSIDNEDKITRAGLTYKEPDKREENMDGTKAVMLIHKENFHLEKILNKVICLEEIEKHQNAVINGREIPSY